jgi:hypothetical protein
MTRGHVAAALTAFAFAWGLALMVYALRAPAYAPDGETIVEVNGAGILLVLAIPAALALVAWIGWHVACAHGSRSALLSGDVAVWLSVLFTFITGFSVGMFTIPGTLALLIAMALLGDRAPAAATAARCGRAA